MNPSIDEAIFDASSNLLMVSTFFISLLFDGSLFEFSFMLQ